MGCYAVMKKIKNVDFRDKGAAHSAIAKYPLVGKLIQVGHLKVDQETGKAVAAR